MITRFMVRCRSFVWYLIIPFTICSIPHFELLPTELAGLLSCEAYAAQTCSASNSPMRDYVYDVRGRVVTDMQLMENGGVSETRYSYSGFSETKTDPEGRVRTETWDYLGRIVRVDETFDGRVLRIAYNYNAANDLLSMTDSQGNITAMAYDNLGRRVSLSDPHTDAWNYAYDDNGSLVRQTDPNGDSIQYSYDSLNRPMQKTPSKGAKTVYAYDSIPNGKGKLSGMTRGDMVDSIGGYDAIGRVMKRGRSYSASQKNFEMAYAYDDSGKTAELTYPDEYKVLFDYHPG